MKQEISKKSAKELIVKNSSIFALTIIPLIASNQFWAIPLALSIGLINTWGDWGSARAKELTDYIIEHKDEFLADVVESDKFKSIFLNIMERHMKEVEEKKRKMFRDYLRNVGKGIHPKFNYHSKLMNILDQITFEELDVINIWNGKLQQKLVEKNKTIGYSLENVDEKIEEIGLNEHQVMFAFENDKIKPSENELVFILKALGNYGLLNTAENNGAAVGSGSDGIRVKITVFGKIFLDFIKP